VPDRQLDVRDDVRHHRHDPGHRPEGHSRDDREADDGGSDEEVTESRFQCPRRRPRALSCSSPVDTTSKPVIGRLLSGGPPTGETTGGHVRDNPDSLDDAMSDATTAVAALKAGIRRFAAVRGWDPYHTPKNLAMALASEVGELCEVFRWLTPEESAIAS